MTSPHPDWYHRLEAPGATSRGWRDLDARAEAKRRRRARANPPPPAPRCASCRCRLNEQRARRHTQCLACTWRNHP